MAATITPSGTSAEERLDRMEQLLGEIRAEMSNQRASRERWSELATDATPIARQALGSVGQALDDSGLTLEDLSSFVTSLAAAMPTLQALLDQLDSLSELAATVSAYLPEATTAVTSRMTDLDERGYFRFVGAGAGVVDRVVTSFSEEDVELLTAFADQLAIALRNAELLETSVLVPLIFFWLLLSLASWGGVLGLFMMFLVLPAVLRYQMILLEARARGVKPEVPGVEFFNWFGNGWTLFPVVIFVFLVWSTVAAGSRFGPVAAGAVLLFSGLFFPASIAVLAITHSPLQSINPIALGRL